MVSKTHRISPVKISSAANIHVQMDIQGVFEILRRLAHIKRCPLRLEMPQLLRR
eukprot:TRINITY_DN10337_c0_g1_i1.p4 TRINITY_DN10337_c0_g1~~TRINITY_DN10337_c0_g1_i1.p4  ORF type:complete len:54 (-),score=8.21 TRINITY_DN10337_c0_g1_i1:260-421(-)